MTSLETINLDLGERAYEIKIGSGVIDQAGDWILSLYGGRAAPKRIAIISDETVASLHMQALQDGLNANPDICNTAAPEIIVLPAGEASKSFTALKTVLDHLLAANFSRSDLIIAFGGGVVGDLAGFAASVLKRGCDFVQIPTSLLAQVDSSVGGKTAINTKAGKNLVGSFYQPKGVLIDTALLSTLPGRHMQAGYAEIVKYGLIEDREFYGWLETNAQYVLARKPGALSRAISTSCRAKAEIVRRDECEQGERALLNLGHSFAHALEAKAAYDGRILHGEAVSAGMLMAFEFSQKLGLCPGQDVHRLRTHLANLALCTFADLPAFFKTSADELLAFMARDKKNTDSDINLVLCRGIGKAFVQKKVDKLALASFLQAQCARK